MSVKRKIYNVLHPQVGEIWCLHRVVPERSTFKSNRELEITPDYLGSMILREKEKGCEFVDIDAFADVVNGSGSKNRLVNISFDDGFADVFTSAYPVLKRHRIPFTFYVTTDMPDGKADLWWLQLEQMANGDEAWFEKTLKEIYACHGEIAAAMHTITSSTSDPMLCQRLSVTWEQLRVMVSEGLCTVGSHGVSHSALSLLPEEQAFRELTASKQRLEKMLGIEVRHFSYPHSFYTEVTNQMVWQAGYQTAVMGYGGVMRRRGQTFFFSRNFVVQS